MSDFTPTPTPSYSGKLRNHMLMVPECINECSGIRIFGRTIKSFVFSTDVATIASVNADAVIAVYPFTPQPRIVRAVISVADMPVFCGVGGGTTRGLYEPLAFYDEAGALMAYAWQAVLPQCRNVLLDYFAVLPQYRGSGVGTAVLKELAAYYAPRKQSLIIECEHPAEAPEPAVARRRIGFYLRAGAHAAAMESRLFGVRYQIYSLPAGGLAKDEEIHRDLQELYRTMVPEPYYRGNVAGTAGGKANGRLK